MDDSLGKRYLIKFCCTVLGTLLSALIQLILPNILTTEDYASYGYNLNVFTSVLAIAILSMDGAFASKISKRREEGGIILFYGKFLALVMLVLNVGMMVLFGTGFGDRLFPGQEFRVVILALNASFWIKLLQEVSSMYDCYALTRKAEPILVIQKILLAGAVLLFSIVGVLRLDLFYLVQIGTILLCVVYLITNFVYNSKPIFVRKEGFGRSNYVSEFAAYCKPLFLSILVSNIITILSNWLLTNYGGSYEQACYNVAWQLNSLIVCTFTPITVLLQREFSIRVENRDELRRFYTKLLRITMFVVAFFSCFVFVNADITLEGLFGERYLDAVEVTRLIMIYTVFQAWGQVNGAMFIASERTKTYSKLIIVSQVFSIIGILVFQIPNFFWPEGLGSIGIGLQRAVCNILSVAIMGIANCKYLGLKAWKDVSIPLLLAIGLAGIAFLSRELLLLTCDSFVCEMRIVRFIVFGFGYVLLAVLAAGIVLRIKKINIIQLVKGMRNGRV